MPSLGLGVVLVPVLVSLLGGGASVRACSPPTHAPVHLSVTCGDGSLFGLPRPHFRLLRPPHPPLPRVLLPDQPLHQPEFDDWLLELLVAHTGQRSTRPARGTRLWHGLQIVWPQP